MRALAIALALPLCACQTGGEIETTPDLAMGQGSPDLASPPITQTTLETAAQKYPDLRTLWARSVARTCGPNSGVCHDNRQFPDLQTASGLLDTVGARCNQIRDDPQTIDNLCEPQGDSIQLGSFSSHIGQVTPMPQGAMPPTSVVITLHDPIPNGTGTAMAALVRQRVGLPAVSFPLPSGAVTAAAGTTVTIDYTLIADPKKAPGPTAGQSLGEFLVPPAFLPGDDTQVELGDPNGDGVFGFDQGGALILPGKPMQSYLFLRVMAPLAVGPGHTNTNVAAAASTEPQMPIANQRYWDLQTDYVALWCWVSGMKPDGSNADGPIDYASCDISGLPTPTVQDGLATTWSSVYSDVLAPSCAGPCHHAGTIQRTTLYLDDPQVAYDTLLGIRGSGPSESMTLPYVTPDDPPHSFLYLKITGDPSAGSRMPLGGELSPAAIDAVNQWITQGANEN